MSATVTFTTKKRTDLGLYQACQDLIAACSLKVTNFSYSLPTGQSETLDGSKDPASSQDWSAIIHLDSYLTQGVNFTFTSNGTNPNLSISRSDKVDKIVLNNVHHAQPAQRIWLYGFIAKAKEVFGSLDSTSHIQSLISEDLQEHYRKREEELAHLQAIAKKLVSDQEEYRQRLDAAYDKRCKDLEESAAKEKALLQAKEDDLAKRVKEVDDRASRHVRRELRQKLHDRLTERNEKFVLSKGTQSLRNPILIFTIILLVFFGSGFIYTFLASAGVIQISPQDGNTFYIKQALFALAFASASYFFIRWNNRWFEQHATEEFAQKRLEIDLDRASWAVELVSEWTDERSKEVPPALLDRITANLFDYRNKPSASNDLHPADMLASAIFGASANATIKLPNGTEVQFDRKSIKDLKKKIVEEDF